MKGIEPSTFSLGSGQHTSQPALPTRVYERPPAAPSVRASSSTLSPSEPAFTDPTLAAVAAAWSRLPAAVRAGIAAMVQAAASQGTDQEDAR